MLNRRIVALVAATSLGAALALGVGLVVGAPDTALPWSVFGGGGTTTSSSASYRLGATAAQSAIGGSQSTNFRLGAGFWYGICKVGSVDDNDCDATADATETGCGSNPGNPASVPERIDGAFAGVDDDGDTQVDEALPGGAGGFDCDGDGFKGSVESHVYGPSTQGDQDPCGTNASPPTSPPSPIGWPADLSPGGGPFPSVNKVSLPDLTSFLAPVRYINTNVGTHTGDVRWDLVPGKGIFTFDININDLTALFAGSTGFPPMLGGARAMNGPACPWPP